MASRVAVESLTMRGIRMREGKSANELIKLFGGIEKAQSWKGGRLAF